MKMNEIIWILILIIFVKGKIITEPCYCTSKFHSSS